MEAAVDISESFLEETTWMKIMQLGGKEWVQLLKPLSKKPLSKLF